MPVERIASQPRTRGVGGHLDPQIALQTILSNNVLLPCVCDDRYLRQSSIINRLVIIKTVEVSDLFFLALRSI